MEQQITFGAGGRILTNCNVWSPDGQWIVYDTRSDMLGERFDGARIAIVHSVTGETRTLYESRNGACCGVATFHPQREQVAFILGPEYPTPEWQYGPAHRQGVLVDTARPGLVRNLDARDLTPPFTPGALRGGSHVHVFSPDGQWVSFTYNDHLLAFPDAQALPDKPAADNDGRRNADVPQTTTGRRQTTHDHDLDQRSIGVSVPCASVCVPRTHARNHDGAYFSALVTRATNAPRPGSDDITLANEEGWIGANGYLRPDGTRQTRALAFQGHVTLADGRVIAEAFVCDLPDDVTIPAPDGPLQGTAFGRPLPPRGTIQRRVTFTADRPYPGLARPRHWLRCSPDGAQIAFLMRDQSGIAQIYTVSPNGGEPRRITRDAWNIASAFTWNAAGTHLAYAADNSVFVVETATGISRRLTPRTDDANAPLPLACVFSPDGSRIAFLRHIPDPPHVPDANAGRSNQICVATIPADAETALLPRQVEAKRL